MSTASPAPIRQLHDATDADLRRLIYSDPWVLVMYVDENCIFCRQLADYLERHANEPRFAHVLFLRIEARETPVAAQHVAATNAPFVAAYRRGRLIHCETVFNEARAEDILLECLPYA